MNILLVSQCNKSALVETRRILDQFAERKGDRTWQTAITYEGLKTLHKLLRKKARRNTAVACHWIKRANRTELLWIVGNIRKFNAQGTVPTNITTRDILRSQDENQWHTVEDIALLAGIAGLFHDFGKANQLFQEKINPSSKRTKRSEPYRHEWVSLRLFEAFVKSCTNGDDRAWLTKLAKVEETCDTEILKKIQKDVPGEKESKHQLAFNKMPQLAQVIAWLIVSHHRLPKFNSNGSKQPNIKNSKGWIGRSFHASWNSSQSIKQEEWSKHDQESVWTFEHGTPFKSKSWRRKAQYLAQRALKRAELFEGKNWFVDNFSLHLSRLVLMLADHCYSAGLPKEKWWDEQYQAYANTDRKTKKLKQRLDEHNIGVGHNAVLLAKCLPKIRNTLPAISRHKKFKQRSTLDKFHWQNKAYDLAVNIRQNTIKQGFFGVNMASTGCGKTLANGRIMYGLADEKVGCRFSIALGLRTLTLQTGDALRQRLKLDEEDIAVLIGSQAVRELYEDGSLSSSESEDKFATIGSESAEEFFAEHYYVRYDGGLDDGRLSQWLKQSPKLHQLLSAPILVSTIDHIIPATEGERGGKQIAPMLRLLTSDLILDEPDDFDLNDLPALTRLVNWAGMLGSRIIISSATLPPALVEALFEAYLLGRGHYQKAIGEPGLAVNVCCAWFDEYNIAQSDHQTLNSFTDAHQNFVMARSQKLLQQQPVRKVSILPMATASTKNEDIVVALAESCHQAIHQLHQHHHQLHPKNNKTVSVGLIRMANINPMVAVARQLFTLTPEENYRIHYCVYHSQHPLIIRSVIERELDKILMRKCPDDLWGRSTIQKALDEYPEQHHVFVVLATPVAEVGRDHDYDWAIAEPSSMRSLIQLAGRVQRHRQQYPNSPNLLIWSTNYKALKGEKIAYTKPGFESDNFKLNSKEVDDIITPEQLNPLTAVPRIQQRECSAPHNNLADLEHKHLRERLLLSDSSEKPKASCWWTGNITWCYELQRRTPFRLSQQETRFLLYFAEENENPAFCSVDDSSQDIKCVEESYFQRVTIQFANRVHAWFGHDFSAEIIQLAEEKQLSLHQACCRFAEIRLRQYTNSQKKWSYEPILGVFHAID
jgi:CRISPR-associated endonuclease/helicase Cas3